MRASRRPPSPHRRRRTAVAVAAPPFAAPPHRVRTAVRRTAVRHRPSAPTAPLRAAPSAPRPRAARRPARPAAERGRAPGERAKQPRLAAARRADDHHENAAALRPRATTHHRPRRPPPAQGRPRRRRPKGARFRRVVNPHEGEAHLERHRLRRQLVDNLELVAGSAGAQLVVQAAAEASLARCRSVAAGVGQGCAGRPRPGGKPTRDEAWARRGGAGPGSAAPSTPRLLTRGVSRHRAATVKAPSYLWRVGHPPGG